MFSKKSIKDGISIAKEISILLEKMLEKNENNIIYKEQIIPKIIAYKDLHDNTPNLVLQDILSEYLLYNRHRLGNNFKLVNFSFKNNRVSSEIRNFCWSAICPAKFDVIEFSHTKCPQLVLYFKEEGISCSFSYGTEVNDKEECVEKMKSKLITFKKLIESPNTFISIRGNKEIRRKPLSSISETELINLWNKNCILFTDISPIMISAKEPREQIISELDKYVQLFIEAIG